MVEINKMVIIKFLELLLAVICMALDFKSQTDDYNTNTLAVVTFGGFIIILCGSFLAQLLGVPFDKKVDLLFSITGAVLFVASGALTLQKWSDAFNSDPKSFGLAKGSLAIINGVIFIVDVFFTWTGK